jgi:hypothetical protein
VAGKEAAKWKFERTEKDVRAPIQHFVIKDKDYLLAVDEGGTVYITNRRGEKVLKPKTKLPSYCQNYFIETGKELATTQIVCADTVGNITKLILGNDAASLKLRDANSNTYFSYKDLDNDGTKEYILLNENELSAYNKDKTLRWQYKFNKSIHEQPISFSLTDGKVKLGIVSKETNEIWLIDENGKPCSGFPFYGSTGFSIGDINKDDHLNVVTADGKFVYLYSME